MILEFHNGYRVPLSLIKTMHKHFSLRRIAQELGVSDLEILDIADASYQDGGVAWHDGAVTGVPDEDPPGDDRLVVTGWVGREER